MISESLQLVIDSAPFLLKGAGYTVLLSVGGMSSAWSWASPWP